MFEIVRFIWNRLYWWICPVSVRRIKKSTHVPPTPCESKAWKLRKPLFFAHYFWYLRSTALSGVDHTYHSHNVNEISYGKLYFVNTVWLFFKSVRFTEQKAARVLPSLQTSLSCILVIVLSLKSFVTLFVYWFILGIRNSVQFHSRKITNCV